MNNAPNRKYAVDILKEILAQEQTKTINEVIKRSKMNKLLEKRGYFWEFIQTAYKLFTKVFPGFRNVLETKISSRQFQQKKIIDPLSKYYCRDFLFYVLEKNPEIPYSFFDKTEDQKRISNYIKNKFLIALHDQIDLGVTFPKKNSRQRPETIKHKEYYSFAGFKSVINHFEDAVFLERYGLDAVKHFPKNSTILDCGAYIGDTAFIFKQILKPKTIVAIEPDKENYGKLLQNIKLNKMKGIVPVNVAISDKKRKCSLNLAGTSAAQLTSPQKTEGEIELDTIDNLVSRLNVKNIKLIKMDIEGHELSAVKGAVKTIQNHKPVLIISLYHKGRDFFEIPPLLKKLNPKYKMRFLSLDAASPVNEYVLIAQ